MINESKKSNTHKEQKDLRGSLQNRATSTIASDPLPFEGRPPKPSFGPRVQWTVLIKVHRPNRLCSHNSPTTQYFVSRRGFHIVMYAWCIGCLEYVYVGWCKAILCLAFVSGSSILVSDGQNHFAWLQPWCLYGSDFNVRNIKGYAASPSRRWTINTLLVVTCLALICMVGSFHHQYGFSHIVHLTLPAFASFMVGFLNWCGSTILLCYVITSHVKSILCCVCKYKIR